MEDPQHLTHPKLLSQNLKRIEVAYLGGTSKGYEEPTVLLLGPDDAVARQLLEMMGALAKVDAVGADKAKQGVSPYPAVPVTADWASRVFSDLGFPDVQLSLSALVGSLFGVIIVADGAVSVVGSPKPAD